MQNMLRCLNIVNWQEPYALHEDGVKKASSNGELRRMPPTKCLNDMHRMLHPVSFTGEETFPNAQSLPATVAQGVTI